MTKGDQAVESAADKLETIVKNAQAGGGVKAKAARAMQDDPEFLRKLKPSLIAKRAKGEAPTDEPAGSPATGATAPSGPQLSRPKPPKAKRTGGGPSPFLVLGAALAAGYFLAKAIDWRGHAHPRD